MKKYLFIIFIILPQLLLAEITPQQLFNLYIEILNGRSVNCENITILLSNQDKIKQGFQEYLTQANKGDKVAQFKVAQACLSGIEKTCELTQSLYWYAASAKQNYAPAELYLGTLFYTSPSASGLTELALSQKKAFKLISMSAQQGDANAQTLLADYYLDGIGTQKDLKQANYWINKALQQNSPAAQIQMGKFYMNGHLVAQDYQMAIKFYRNALENPAITLDQQWVVKRTFDYLLSNKLLKNSNDVAYASAELNKLTNKQNELIKCTNEAKIKYQKST